MAAVRRSIKADMAETEFRARWPTEVPGREARYRRGRSPAIEKQRDKHRLKEAKSFGEFGEKWLTATPMADSTRAMRRAIFERELLLGAATGDCDPKAIHDANGSFAPHPGRWGDRCYCWKQTLLAIIGNAMFAPSGHLSNAGALLRACRICLISHTDNVFQAATLRSRCNLA